MEVGLSLLGSSYETLPNWSIISSTYIQ